MSTLTRKDFPKTADNRFYVVTHNPKSMAKPVTIELREYASEGARERKFKSMSTLIGFITTTADQKELLAAAFELDRRVGNVDNVVGTY